MYVLANSLIYYWKYYSSLVVKVTPPPLPE